MGLAVLRNSLLSKHIGMTGSSHSMVSDKIGLKSNVLDVGISIFSSINAHRNRQADPILMVCLVHSKVLLFIFAAIYAADLVQKN